MFGRRTFLSSVVRTSLLEPIRAAPVFRCSYSRESPARDRDLRHPYDEIQFIREGHGVWTVNGNTFEGGAGDIFVIEAGEIHSFKAIGDSPLIQLDVHLSPRFIQENL